MEKVWKIVLDILKAMDWKKILWETYTSALKPKLTEFVNDTESKWDNFALDAVELLVEKFLKPEA